MLDPVSTVQSCFTAQEVLADTWKTMACREARTCLLNILREDPERYIFPILRGKYPIHFSLSFTY